MTKSPLGFRGAIIGVLLFFPALLFSANITVPTFELITHASPLGGVYALQTYGNVVIQIEGGYKFGAQIDLNFLSSINPNFSLEQYPGNSLGVYGASAIMREVFGSSIDISYFVGQNDYFCRGDGFSYFGATTFATSYSGYMYFPAGPLYQGIYQVNGTGVRVDITPVIESFRVSLSMLISVIVSVLPISRPQHHAVLCHFPPRRVEHIFHADACSLCTGQKCSTERSSLDIGSRHI